MALADIVSKKFFDALDLQLTWKHMISCNWTVGGTCSGQYWYNSLSDSNWVVAPF